MRVLSSSALAALQGRVLPLALLTEMALSSPLNLNTASLDLTVNGTTYYGTKGLGTIDPIPETPVEVRSLKLTLSGVPSTSIALALTEQVQGKALTIKLAIFDLATYQVLDVRTRWAGRLDVFTIDDGGSSSTLSVSAEHAGIDLTRPGNLLYTDAAQQTLVPGDYVFQFLNDQVEQRIVWPAASWGRQ